MDFMDIAYVGYYSHLEDEWDKEKKLMPIVQYLRDNGETEEVLNEACIKAGIRELSAEEMQWIGKNI